MTRKFLSYSAGLIALYLVVANSTNAGADISKAASGASNVIKSLQGR